MTDPSTLELSEREQQLKDEFIAARGYWSSLWDGVLALDASFFEAYLRFSEVPWRHGPLAPKDKELIYTAIDAATTHLFEPGLRIHIINALRLGATVEEIMAVLEITATLGIHTCTVGVPILLEELAAAGRPGPDAKPELSARQAEVKARFIDVHGEWQEVWDGVAALDPDFFEAYVDLAALPWREGVLEPKLRELILIAIDSSTTHLHEPSLRSHVRNALRHGADAAEIMEVFELTSVLGIHTCTIGVPVLLQEAAR